MGFFSSNGNTYVPTNAFYKDEPLKVKFVLGRSINGNGSRAHVTYRGFDVDATLFMDVRSPHLGVDDNEFEANLRSEAKAQLVLATERLRDSNVRIAELELQWTEQMDQRALDQEWVNNAFELSTIGLPKETK